MEQMEGTTAPNADHGAASPIEPDCDFAALDLAGNGRLVDSSQPGRDPQPTAPLVEGAWNPLSWLNRWVTRPPTDVPNLDKQSAAIVTTPDPAAPPAACNPGRLVSNELDQAWLDDQLSLFVSEAVVAETVSSKAPNTLVTGDRDNVFGDSSKPPVQDLNLTEVSVTSTQQFSVNRAAVAVGTHVSGAGLVAIDAVRTGVVAALIAGIRLVSAERDRDEILCWFASGRDILASDDPTATKAKKLYQTIDTLRFATLLGSTIRTSLYSYKSANLPLALKVALPVTMIGAASFGMKGAGIVAFGSGIGLPVVLLLFLGTAGATAVLEAFVKDRHIRDPLTKLLLTFVAFESARRAKKELLAAMRADAMVPKREAVPPEEEKLLAFLMEMDPIAFERHVMSFFEVSGHPTVLTARSNDFGVDGYVFHPNGVVVVQCKRNAADNPVGRPIVQQITGVVEEQGAFRGYVVTTSRFTAEAQESAAKNNRIVLIDGTKLLKWHAVGRVMD